jgi:hypothetical protein
MVQDSLDRLEWVLADIRAWFQEWASLVVMAVTQAMAVSLVLEAIQFMEELLALEDSLPMQEWEWVMGASLRVAAAAAVNPLYMKIFKKLEGKLFAFQFLCG